MQCLFHFRTMWVVLPALAFLMTGCHKPVEQEEKIPAVTYMEVDARPLTLTRKLSGRVVAFQVAEVRPQVGGIIKERVFTEGADVVAGELLYQIDPALYQASFNNAKAELARVEANLVSARLLAQRYAKLIHTHAISKQDYDDAVAARDQAAAAVEAAKQALETARINLDYTQVTAPVSGRIGRSLITPGALATQHQASPLATIQQLNPVYVDVTQSSIELLRLRRDLSAGRLRSSGKDAAKVRLLLEDGSPYIRNMTDEESTEKPDWIEGDLLFSDVTIDQSTGSVTLRITIENPQQVLLPGMYVHAVLEEGIKEEAIRIPQKTVMRDTRGNPYVYVLTTADANEKSGAGPAVTCSASRRHITLDRDYENQWLVAAGLKKGEWILVDGFQKIQSDRNVAATRVNSQKTGDVLEIADAGARR